MNIKHLEKAITQIIEGFQIIQREIITFPQVDRKESSVPDIMLPTNPPQFPPKKLVPTQRPSIKSPTQRPPLKSPSNLPPKKLPKPPKKTQKQKESEFIGLRESMLKELKHLKEIMSR